MTALELDWLAWRALKAIRAGKPENVYAARPGICAGIARHPLDGGPGNIIFRRTEDGVKVELSRYETGRFEVRELPADLEREAGKMLDWIK